MIVYRLSKANYSKDVSGKGAEKSGGRWNSKGIPMVYTSETRALCTTEIAVHTPLGIVPLNYEIIQFEISDKVKIHTVDENTLTKDWKSFPHVHSTQEIGDKFIKENKYLVLKVPSAVVQGEYNFLINPNHKDFKMLKIKSIEAFSFDERLFKK